MTIWTGGKASSFGDKESKCLGTQARALLPHQVSQGGSEPQSQAHATPLCCLLNAQPMPSACPAQAQRHSRVSSWTQTRLQVTPRASLFSSEATGKSGCPAHANGPPEKRPICPPNQPPQFTKKQGPSPSDNGVQILLGSMLASLQV